MIFRHQFEVAASLPAVSQFHSQSSSMGQITPPPVVVRVHAAPPVLKEGDQMDFTLWLGPLPVRWLAKIEHVTPQGFVDRQLKGPFKAWVHTHTFRELAANRTLVLDQVEAQINLRSLWAVIGLGMWLTLPLLFAFRSWKTRRLLAARR